MRLFLKFLIFFLITTSASAFCDFKYTIGQKIKNDDFLSAPEKGYLVVNMYADQICSDASLKGPYEVRYHIYEQKILAIDIILTFYDPNNELFDNTAFMKYVKRTYGAFDTGSNPKEFSGTITWDKSGKKIIYSRSFNNYTKLVDEGLTISTEKNMEKLIKAYYETR